MYSILCYALYCSVLLRHKIYSTLCLLTLHQSLTCPATLWLSSLLASTRQSSSSSWSTFFHSHPSKLYYFVLFRTYSCLTQQKLSTYPWSPNPPPVLDLSSNPSGWVLSCQLPSPGLHQPVILQLTRTKHQDDRGRWEETNWWFCVCQEAGGNIFSPVCVQSRDWRNTGQNTC